MQLKLKSQHWREFLAHKFTESSNKHNKTKHHTSRVYTLSVRPAKHLFKPFVKSTLSLLWNPFSTNFTCALDRYSAWVQSVFTHENVLQTSCEESRPEEIVAPKRWVLPSLFVLANLSSPGHFPSVVLFWRSSNWPNRLITCYFLCASELGIS